MKPERFQLVRALYHEICELPEAERRRALAQRDIDAETRAEVEELLGYSERKDAFEDSALGEVGRQLARGYVEGLDQL